MGSRGAVCVFVFINCERNTLDFFLLCPFLFLHSRVCLCAFVGFPTPSPLCLFIRRTSLRSWVRFPECWQGRICQTTGRVASYTEMVLAPPGRGCGKTSSTSLPRQSLYDEREVLFLSFRRTRPMGLPCPLLRNTGSGLAGDRSAVSLI